MAYGVIRYCVHPLSCSPDNLLVKDNSLPEEGFALDKGRPLFLRQLVQNGNSIRASL